MPWLDLFLYMVTGALAGLAAGLLGVGGGLIIVPVLVIVFASVGVDDSALVHLAVGTSLATIVFTSLSSTWAHHRRGAVLWPVFWRYLPGVLLGALLGALLADNISSDSLGRVFGVFELTVATWMLANRQPHPHRGLPGTVGLILVGLVVGTISALVGIAGGTMTVPFLIWCNQPAQKAVATSAASGIPIALAGVTGFILVGLDSQGLPAGATGYVYWPAVVAISVASVSFAPLGARIAHTLDPVHLKRVFALVLLGLGIYMLSGG